MGCLTQVRITAATRAVPPSPTSACWVFLCFRNPPNSDTDYRFFNVIVWAKDEINVPIALSAFRDKIDCVIILVLDIYTHRGWAHRQRLGTTLLTQSFSCVVLAEFELGSLISHIESWVRRSTKLSHLKRHLVTHQSACNEEHVVHGFWHMSTKEHLQCLSSRQRHCMPHTLLFHMAVLFHISTTSAGATSTPGGTDQCKSDSAYSFLNQVYLWG